MEKVQSVPLLLDRYRSAATSQTLPCYVKTAEKHTSILDTASASTEDLWVAHANPGVESLNACSLLDVKIELASRIMQKCTLCEWRCGKDRTAGDIGFCGVGANSYYFFEQILCGEEAPVIPSHEVFFSGCNMNCRFCYSWQSLENTTFGQCLNPANFADIVENRKTEGAVNINLIGGEPTIHLLNILQTIKLFKSPVPIVWNSNFYMSEETMHLLDGIVDLYLGDFKFGNDECAFETGGINRYCETATRNFKLAADNTDLIIRHLVLPGHVECCFRPIAEWISANMPAVPVSIMFQYTPFYKALNDPALCRSLTPEEIEEVRSIAESLNLNTTEWNTPLDMEHPVSGLGTGNMSTTVIIRPDGQVAFMHLHNDLIKIVESLENGGNEIA
jgi:putative pyruvate formate lyase activating enzyme